MARRRASMREGPLAELFKATRHRSASPIRGRARPGTRCYEPRPEEMATVESGPARADPGPRRPPPGERHAEPASAGAELLALRD